MSKLVGRVRCRCEYRVCGGCEGGASPGRAKNNPPGWEKNGSWAVSAAPELKVKKPAGLKTGPVWEQLDLLSGRWSALWRCSKESG